MSDPLVVTGACALGLVLLGYHLWARRGRSRAARWWMADSPAARGRSERMTLLGTPSLGAFCFCLVGFLSLPEGHPLRGVVVPIALLLLLLVTLAALPGIRLPEALYPRWARQEVRRRRELDDPVD